MPSTATTVLRLQKMASGEKTGVWGDETNVNWNMVDKAFSSTSISTSGGTTTLSNSDYTVDEATAEILDVSGSLGSNATIVIPNAAKKYIVLNRTSGSFTLTIKTSSGSGIEVTQSAGATIVCDGSNVCRYATPITVLSTGAPATASGAAASSVSVTPTGNLSSSTVQAALAELQGDIDTIDTALGNKQPLDADLTTIAGLATTKGNSMFATGAAWAAVAVGSNGLVMRANSAQSSGVEWAAGSPATTSAPFQQTAAPTGWTKSTSHNDKALRVVSGSASSGGSTAFSTVMSATRAVSGTGGSTAITEANLPAHTHPITADPSNTAGFVLRSTGSTAGGGGGPGVTGGTAAAVNTGSTGSGTGHTHGAGSYVVDLSVHYVDLILATAN